MRIVAVTGSPRGSHSQSRRLAQAILDGARGEGAEGELVDLCRLKIEYCMACDVCHRTGACVRGDDFPMVRAKLLAADGLVLASPDYFRTVSAQMKTMIDRLADAIHCQLLAGKYVCSAATSGGPAGEEVTHYLNEVFLSMGAWVVGGVAASVGQGPAAVAEAEQRARALGRELAQAIATSRVYADQRERHRQTAGYFRQLVVRNRDLWAYEYALWQHAAPEA